MFSGSTCDGTRCRSRGGTTGGTSVGTRAFTRDGTRSGTRGGTRGCPQLWTNSLQILTNKFDSFNKYVPIS